MKILYRYFLPAIGRKEITYDYFALATGRREIIIYKSAFFIGFEILMDYEMHVAVRSEIKLKGL
jgi:hypothetical protein